jgi:hypothetical protein
MYCFHYVPRPACWGSASLYVPPLNYKREGTQHYRTGSHRLNSLSIQLTHSGGRVLHSSGLNHSKLRVNVCSSQIHIIGKLLRPLLIIGLGRVHSAIQPKDFLSNRVYYINIVFNNNIKVRSIET